MPKQQDSFLTKLDNQVKLLNNSKVFAGVMIILLNLSTRFVNFKLSKTTEAYLKNTFSTQVLVFAIAWMGSRDIYIALIVTAVFILFTEYLFNEDSEFCIFSEEFKDYHNAKQEREKEDAEEVSEEDIIKAKRVLEKAKKTDKLSLELESYKI
jgi:spore germination protein GerM